MLGGGALREIGFVTCYVMQDVGISSAYMHQKQRMPVRIGVPPPCSVSRPGTEPAQGHPHFT